MTRDQVLRELGEVFDQLNSLAPHEWTERAALRRRQDELRGRLAQLHPLEAQEVMQRWSERVNGSAPESVGS